MDRINLEEEDIDALLYEIPSDCESITDSEYESDSNEETVNVPVDNIDIMDIPIVFLDNSDEPSTSRQSDTQPSSESEPPTSSHEHQVFVPNSPAPNDDSANQPAEIDNLPTIIEPCPVPSWQKRNSRLIDNAEEFEEDSGVVDRIKNMLDPTPLKLFSQLFTHELMELIVFQTNLYATQAGKNFIPTTIDEIRVFLGINLYMGIKRLPSYRDYWSTSPDLHDEFVSKLMTVKRFSFLLSHLHLNDNILMPRRGMPGFDKLYKLRPMLSILSKTFEDCYRPHQKLVIDECMVKFKGRSSLKQYMRDKPVKRGYKIWMLCDESSYNLKFQIYTGKVEGSNREFNLGERIVTDLCRGLEGKNHIAIMDNYFTSYSCFYHLKEKKIMACGTVNPSRKNLPKFVEDKTLKRGEFDYSVSNHGLSAYKWKDNKCVYFLSNFHNPGETVEVQRKEKDGTRKSIPCPKIVPDYNSNMNYVDNFDRLKGDYKINRRSRKWWPRIFFHLLDCCVVNAFIMHKEINMEQLTHKDFRRSVYTDMLSKCIVEKISPTQKKRKISDVKGHKPHVADCIRLEGSKHKPVKSSSRRCAVCSTKAVVVRSVWSCSICGVALCLRGEKTCFNDFHK